MMSQYYAAQTGETSSNPPHSPSNQEMPQQKKMGEDTEEIASFLLSLKHRSVTPEPPAIISEPSYQVSSLSHVTTSLEPQVQHVSCVDKTPACMMEEQQQQAAMTTMVEGEINVEGFLNDSKLVVTKDRDLVPDALFVAMAQMKPCKLTQADRVGCYKSRELGFVGMSCIHCSGQPGFGRYYPNSVRSLAQTTTSQTILKHVGGKCRFCPPHIRKAVIELQIQQAAREGMSTGRPRYGSRKIFFQRVWARLHGESTDEEGDDSSSNQTPSDLVSEMESRQSSPATSDDESSQHSSLSKTTKRKFGVLPTQKNLKRSFMGEEDNAVFKRPRVLSN